MSAATAALLSRPPALTQFVLKVHSRCDLACDHCYVYEHADQSWRKRPRVMAPDVVRQAAARIAEHAAAHRLPIVHVILHGGEPLLMGIAALRSTLAELRTVIEPVAALDLRMQSNGVLLTEELCDLLVEFGVMVGVSLDGDRIANDRHRRFPSGASSHADVRRALALLRRPQYRRSYAGLLCTIDIANDPIRVYEALLAEEPPRIDLLLPHATWERPPARLDGDPTPYATWLGRIYRRWESDGHPVPIRMFDSVLSTADGGPSGTETLGLDPADLIVIETDGEWEQPDSMKTAYDGAPATGLDIFTHTAGEAAAHPSIARRLGGLDELSQTCQSCPVVHQCGGGLYAHRYHPETGFDNPSVYCADLKGLIISINDRRRPAAETTTTDALPTDVLDQIASGYGDEAAVQYLAGTQLAITRALVVAAADRVTGAAADGWELLGRLDREAPEAVRSVLAHPYVRVWAVSCLSDEGGDRDYLSCLAAAAAIRAEAPVDIGVPIRAGRVHLPTLGTLRIPTATGDAVLSVGPGGFTVRAGGFTISIASGAGMTAVEAWRPTRRVVADGLNVLIEDGDPYRDCHEWEVDGRLPAQAAAAWTRSVVGAWRGIQRDVPGQVPGMSVGLAAIAPLLNDHNGPVRSATSRHAFGALGATAADPEGLAVVLVHEFQHSKLGAVMDLVHLSDPAYRQRLRVGWRPDPRPVEGVLQGIYAHLGVADIWRARAAAITPEPQAAAQFRHYRDWTAAAIDALTATGALTSLGERFVTRMGETLQGWPP